MDKIINIVLKVRCVNSTSTLQYLCNVAFLMEKKGGKGVSEILHDAAIKAMKEAHASFMRGDRRDYREKMKVADGAINAIRSLGVEHNKGREIELLALEGEKTLLSSLPQLKYPGRLLRIYGIAEIQLQVYTPPSQVITKDMPYLPPYDDLFDFYGVPLEKADRFAEQLTSAIRMYGKLTGGGGAGVDLLYRAGIMLRRKRYEEAKTLTNQAQSIAGEWLNAHIERLFEQIEREEL